MKELKEYAPRRTRQLEEFREGRDEMNLAELPLAAINDRFHGGEKTAVFVDEVWDEEKREFVKRKLSISGSDLYGLPTAKDDDVLLACVQLSSLGDFHSREVHFSRYELLKLLRWEDQTRNYRRLAESLRRWKGVTIYSNRAFYDHGRKSWVSRDFGIFDNLSLYEREEQQRREAPAKSLFLWNEVLFSSFQSGYLKHLDWDLYLSLKDPVAKRLYRLLDKRFYRRGNVRFDLHELAFNKVRVSRSYNTAQVKRALLGGIRELEAVWELEAMTQEERFHKLERGKWEAVFVRRRKRPRVRKAAVPEGRLLESLTKRGVLAGVATKLVQECPRERIEKATELFDWYKTKGQVRGAGFLVSAIRSDEEFVAPKGFIPHSRRQTRKPAPGSHFRPERRVVDERAIRRSVQEKETEGAFRAFWATLEKSQRSAFETSAILAADPTKRSGYRRLQDAGGMVFEQYRQIILREYFLRTAEKESLAPDKAPLAKTDLENSVG